LGEPGATGLRAVRIDRAPELAARLPTSDLESVSEALQFYPRTELGWSVLPVGRAEYMKALESRMETEDVRGEISDLQKAQFQEDRPHVEHLRETIKSVLTSSRYG